MEGWCGKEGEREEDEGREEWREGVGYGVKGGREEEGESK